MNDMPESHAPATPEPDAVASPEAMPGSPDMHGMPGEDAVSTAGDVVESKADDQPGPDAAEDASPALATTEDGMPGDAVAMSEPEARDELEARDEQVELLPDGMPMAMRDCIAYIAASLADAPDAVQVSARRDEAHGGATVIELRVAQDDLGKVIGRQGRTAKAMRTLLGAAASRHGGRVVLDILE